MTSVLPVNEGLTSAPSAYKARASPSGLVFLLEDVMELFQTMTCRKCECENPISFFGPVDNLDGTSSVVCVSCARDNGWLDRDDNLKEGYQV